MRFQRTCVSTCLLAVVGIATCLLSGEKACAVILAQDDFSSPTSGTGWAAGNQWEGLGGGQVSTAGSVISFRDFAAPINGTNQVTYVRFNFTSLVPGTGANWGGASFFEGVQTGPGSETLFMGEPGQFPRYGFDLHNGSGGALDSGIAVNNQPHTIIAAIDTTAVGTTDATYRVWVDNFNLNSPNATTTINNTPIDAAWGTFRLAADGSNTALFDNLTIATTADEVGLLALNATATISRLGGNITLSSSTPLPNVLGYTLASNGGAFKPAGWTTITDHYDEPPPGNGSVDPDDDWSVTSPPGNTTALSEMTFSTTPGNGGTIGPTPVDLGVPWESTPIEDVRGTLILNNNGTQLPAAIAVNYIGPAIANGDLNGDHEIDVADWNAFKAGQGIVNNTMTQVQAYRLGDMDRDLDRDLFDFSLFKTAFDAENGAGAFDAMLAGIPEPGSIALVTVGSLICCAVYRRRARRTLLIVVAIALGFASFTQPANATVFAQDDMSSPTSGTGWFAGSNWGARLMNGVVMTNPTGDDAVFRRLATPLEPYNSDTIYIGFDFQAAHGNMWGGLAFFEGTAGGDETLFIGDPSQYNAYGYDMKQGGLLPADNSPNDQSPPTGGIMVDPNFHRLIAAIDFDDDATAPFDDTYSLWVDNFNQNSPNYTVTIQNSPIQDAWQSVRVGSGGESIKVDNVIITDEPGLVFVAPVQLELTVNKTTGIVTMANNSAEVISIDAYTINSPSGQLNPGSAAGDYNGDGSVDAADYVVWRKSNINGQQGYNDWRTNFGSTGGGAGGWNSLAEQNLPGFPAGNGSGNGWEEGGNPSVNQLEEYFLRGTSNVASGATVALGAAYGGGAAGTQDVTFIYRSGEEVKLGSVRYVTSGAGAAVVPEPASAAFLAAALAAGFLRRRPRLGVVRNAILREVTCY